MNTLELLVRTHFTLVSTEKGTNLKNVVGYGSGFMMQYKEYRFLVTAAHVNEPNWSEQAKVKSIMDNDVAIVTHLAQMHEGKMKTVYVPIGGFMYVNSIKVDVTTKDFETVLQDAEENPIPVDVAVALVEERPEVFTFSYDKGNEEGSDNLETAPKILIPYEAVIEPDHDDHYFVFGRIKFVPKLDAQGNTYVDSEARFHCDMEFLSTLENHVLVFKVPENIVYEDWAGISGSPILNPEGYIVGIACSVLPNTHYMYGLDITQVRPLFDMLIHEKKEK